MCKIGILCMRHLLYQDNYDIGALVRDPRGAKRSWQADALERGTLQAVAEDVLHTFCGA